MVGVGVVALGFAIGARPLSDNSFLTHLATGRLIIDDWRVPTVDPYTFTAKGTSWVVQSWLPSSIYALAEDLAGGAGIRFVMGLLTAAIAAGIWLLLGRVEGLIVRVGLMALALGIGWAQWSSRPLLFGLAALVSVVLAAEDHLSVRWLLPIGWLWVNSHGSFPLGIVYLVAVILGTRLDRGVIAHEVSCLRWLGAGVLLGVLNPLGPRVLLFPVELLQRQEVLQTVREWQAPDFQSLGQRLFLLQVVIVLFALVRRPSGRSAAVVAVFLVAALLGRRNIGASAIVFVPVLGAAWADVGGLRSSARPALARVGAAAMVALLLLVVIDATRGPHIVLDRYPVEMIDRIEAEKIDLTEVRLGAPELVGNLQELRGARGTVFFDDRFDLFSDELIEDYNTMSRGSSGATEVLDRWNLDLLLWPSEAALSQILDAMPAWRVLDTADGWRLFCRSGVLLTRRLAC